MSREGSWSPRTDFPPRGRTDPGRSTGSPWQGYTGSPRLEQAESPVEETQGGAPGTACAALLSQGMQPRHQARREPSSGRALAGPGSPGSSCSSAGRGRAAPGPPAPPSLRPSWSLLSSSHPSNRGPRPQVRLPRGLPRPQPRTPGRPSGRPLGAPPDSTGGLAPRSRAPPSWNCWSLTSSRPRDGTRATGGLGGSSAYEMRDGGPLLPSRWDFGPSEGPREDPQDPPQGGQEGCENLCCFPSQRAV